MVPFLSEEHLYFSDALDKYLRANYAIKQRNKIAYSTAGFNQDIWNDLVEIGALATLFPEHVGGLGGGGLDITNLFEKLGKYLVMEPLLASLAVGHTLISAGGHEQLVTNIVNGAIKVAFIWEEKDSRYDPLHVHCRAVWKNDAWVVNGEKTLVHQACSAQHLLISTQAYCPVTGATGITLFIVPTDTPGISQHSYGATDGGSCTEYRFQDVNLSETTLVGDIAQGHIHLEKGVQAATLALSAEALGTMQAITADTLEYLRTRQQFGAILGSYQALQHRMAALLLEVEQMKSALLNAAMEFTNPESVARKQALSAAKYTADRVGTLIAEEAIQMHGGIGMTAELPLSHYVKRMLMINHRFGDAHYHLNQYARYLDGPA